MKKSWEEKKLGEVIKLEYGKPLPKDKRISNGKYPVYGANGEKDRTDEFYYDRSSIIVGRKGSAGEINLTEKRFWPLDVTYFVTFDDKKYSLGFLYDLLLTLNLPKLAKGVKPGINRNEVYEIRASFPPLLEQKRIVAILDKAFAAISTAKANAEKNLQNARELFESYLQGVFANPGDGWEVKKLGDICEVLDRKRKPITKRDRIAGKYPYYGATGILDYVHDYIFNEKLILIGEDGAKWGAGENTAFIAEGKYWVNNHAHVIRPDRSIMLDNWIVYFLNVSDLQKYVTGLTVPKLNQEKMRGITLPLPPLTEQQRIVAKFDALSAETKKLENVYQQKQADLEELKKSVLQKAFNGELPEVKI